MKIKANKILAVLCVIAMVMTMIVPMTMTATAEELSQVCDFSTVSGTQYADETKTFGDITVTTHNKGCHFNTQLRIYDSASNNGWAIASLPEGYSFVSLTINVGYKAATLNVYGSNDGETWTLIQGVATATSYKDYVVDASGYAQVKLDAAGAQLRVAKLTATYVASSGEENTDPSVKVTGDAYTQVGGTIELTATTENVTGALEWASSDENVATVADGLVTAKAMGKTTITATADGATDDIEITVFPVEGPITIAEALEVCELTGTTNAPYVYSVTGEIESIDTAYDSGYNNITVTITDGTGSIKAFRMVGGETLTLGNKIAVAGTLVNYYGNTPEFIAGCTYELVLDDTTADIVASLNAIDAYMSLAYTYVGTTEEREVSETSTVIDTLNLAFTGVSGTNYSDWSGKTGASSAVYAGNSAGGNDSIQLRSKNSNSGVVTTVSGGKATKIAVKWNSNTTGGRTIDVYGSNTAYSAATDLYGNNKGTKLGTIVMGTSTELVITGDYQYIGFRSNSSALYLDSVEITWEKEGAGTGATEEVEVFSNSQFVLNCGVDAGLANIEGVTSYGIAVTAGNNTVYYTTEANSWTVGNDDTVSVYIDLGDIINKTDRLSTEFTVRAFVVVGEETYVSELTKTYSVASMVAEYYEDLKIAEVEHLYDVLVGYGLIAEEV